MDRAPGNAAAASRAQRLERELRERRKELQALYSLSALVAKRGTSLDEVFRGVLRLIPPSWQWPESTAARILFDGRELRDPRFREGGPVQASPIATEGTVRGRIEVTLLEPPPDGDAPFLEEEQALLDVIAERLGTVAVSIARENALRQSERRFRLAVDQFPYTFVIYDAERRIRFINARGVEMSGLSEREILGRRDEEIHPPEVVGGFLPTLLRAFETRRPQNCACHVELTTGSYDILVSYVPVLDEGGEILQVLGTTWDVTEERRREAEQRNLEAQLRQAQKLESLGLLAGGIAHDFNNLLTVVLASAEEIRSRLGERTDLLASLLQIDRAVGHAADLTRQMLLYAGREKGRFEEVRLDALVRDLAGLLRHAGGRSVDLALDLEPDLPPLRGDPAQLRQVVMNLVINAAEATTAGGHVRVRIRSRHVERAELERMRLGPGREPGWYVALEVADDGVGMDTETLERLFEPFYSTKRTGRGLGLAAVLGIVSGHEGAVEISSAPGRGTTFRILLPGGAPGRGRSQPRSAIPGDSGSPDGASVLSPTLGDTVTGYLGLPGRPSATTPASEFV